MQTKTYYKSPIGMLQIRTDGTSIIEIQRHQNTIINEKLIAQEITTPLLKSAVRQLEEYFSKIRKSFDLPLAPEGTPFQKRVWTALGKIPYGETRTYKQIAETIGSPQAARAVGLANNRNPIMIIIPCHRVIGADGSLVGYACGLEIKEKLLNLEKTSILPQENK